MINWMVGDDQLKGWQVLKLVTGGIIFSVFVIFAYRIMFDIIKCIPD